MKEKDIISGMEFIDEKYIEESENFSKKRFKTKASLLLAAALLVLFSVTAVAAAKFFNTVNEGEIVFMEALKNK